jgi:hypothetical protein
MIRDGGRNWRVFLFLAGDLVWVLLLVGAVLRDPPHDNDLLRQ